MGEDCAATGKDRLGAPQLSALRFLVKTLSIEAIDVVLDLRESSWGRPGAYSETVGGPQNDTDSRFSLRKRKPFMSLSTQALE